MRVFIFLLCLLPLAFAHVDLEYTDRFQANKMTRCECENVTLIGNHLALYNAATGSITSNEIKSRTFFNAASITYSAEVPEGASLKVEICAQGSDYQWGEWKTVAQPEADVHFEGNHESYRYRVTFAMSKDGHSPKLREIQVSYNFIFPEVMQEVAFLEQEKRGIAKPTVISRSEWKARSAKNAYSYHSPRKLTIHHTYRPLASNFRGASTIRSIQNYHMDNNGWSDIGYHFLIGTFSSGSTVVYQGRPEDVIGAHTGGANTNNVGVNLIGDYDVEQVNPDLYKKMVHVLAWLCDEYSIDSSQIYAHKDFNSTLCPGKNLYDLLPQIRQDVRHFGLERNEVKAMGTLIGAVYDNSKGSTYRLSGATVTLNNGKKATTGSDGLFRFEIAPGSYSYSISKSGYKSASASRSVKADEMTWGSVGLTSTGGSSKVLSGAHWVKQFPPSRQIKDLNEPFRSKMQRFYSALKSAGANVNISNTLRPPQRAFLMHYAYRISKEGLDPRKIPAKSGVNIEWWHGSKSKSVSAARSMVSAYGIVYRPSLTSNHIRGQAIDMSISWSGTLRIKKANGSTVSISSPRSGASNKALWSVGASYGVYKLASDAPHWSHNGH